MNEKLQEILISTLEKAQTVGGKIVDSAGVGFEKAVDFAQNEIPKVIEELLTWEFAYHGLRAGCWLLIIIIILSSITYFRKRISKLEELTGNEKVIVDRLSIVIAIFLSSVMFFNGVISNVGTCVKIKYAPRIFLIEYCSDLIRVKRENERKEMVDPRLLSKPVHNH